MTSSGDDQVDAAVSGTGNVVAGGQDNQVLSNVSAQGDVVLGDKVGGDKIGRDKVVIERVEHLVLQSPAGATVWSWPRPWDFGGYLQEKRKGFTGRQWLFDKVSAWHHNPNAPQALLIEADFGVGKSAFMAELCATGTTQRQLPVVAHHFCDHNTAATLEADTFLRSLAAQLAMALPAYKAAVESDPAAREWLDKAEGDPASAFSQAIASKLAAIEAPACHQLLLVDGLDETLGAESIRADDKGVSIVALLAGATARLPGWLRVLATSRGRQKVRQPLQQAYKCQELDAEQGANLDDIRDYVATRCRAEPLAGLLTAAGKRPESVAELLCEKSGGKFLYPVRVLNDLANGSLEADRLEDLPPGMDGFYLDAFQRRFPSADDYAPMGPLLGLLGQAQEPLDRGILAAILGVEEQWVQKALLRIEDFLRITAKGQGPPGITAPTYAFDHLSLAQWLTEENNEGFPRAGDLAVDAGAARRRIAVWAKEETAAGRAHQWPYLTRHIAAHLDPTARAEVFGDLLVDLPWLEARLRWADLTALLGDFRWGEVPQLQKLERALHQGAHVLIQYPDQLPVQLLARWPETTKASTAEVRLRQQATMRVLQAGAASPTAASLQDSEALLRTLTGHGSQITALAVLPNGRLASGYKDGTIKLWDPDSGTCTATLEGHSSSVWALAVLPGGRLASAAGDSTIKLWDPDSGSCIATLTGHGSQITALAVLPGGRLASAAGDSTIKLWDPDSGSCTATLEGHSDLVSALAVLPGGRLASGSWDCTIKLWDLASGSCTATMEGHSDWVWALAMLPGGRLASAADDSTIKLWDPDSGGCTATLEGHSFSVSALAVLPGGRLASGSGDHTIKLWDPGSGSCTATLESHSRQVSALAVLPGRWLASGSGDHTIKLWDPDSGTCTATKEGHSFSVSALAVLPGGRLASGYKDGTIKVWDPDSGTCTATLEGHSFSVRALAVLPGGRLASGFGDHTIELRDPDSGTCTATLEVNSDLVSALAVLSGGRLASGYKDGTIKLWDPDSGTCTATMEVNSFSVSALAVLPGGRLASGYKDGTIKLWDPDSGTCTATMEGHSFSVSALAVLPGGQLASGYKDGTIKVWDLDSDTCTATLEGHSNSLWALAVLPDGRLAFGSDDHTITLWDPGIAGLGSGQMIFVADATITVLAFLPGPSLLVAGDTSGRLHWLRLSLS